MKKCVLAPVKFTFDINKLKNADLFLCSYLHFVVIIEAFIYLLTQQTIYCITITAGNNVSSILFSFSVVIHFFISFQLGFSKFFYMNTGSKLIYMNSRELEDLESFCLSFWQFENLHQVHFLGHSCKSVKVQGWG